MLNLPSNPATQLRGNKINIDLLSLLMLQLCVKPIELDLKRKVISAYVSKTTSYLRVSVGFSSN
jgi:hypothetical protein